MSRRSCEDCPLWGAFILNEIEHEATCKGGLKFWGLTSSGDGGVTLPDNVLRHCALPLIPLLFPNRKDQETAA